MLAQQKTVVVTITTTGSARFGRRIIRRSVLRHAARAERAAGISGGQAPRISPVLILLATSPKVALRFAATGRTWGGQDEGRQSGRNSPGSFPDFGRCDGSRSGSLPAGQRGAGGGRLQPRRAAHWRYIAKRYIGQGCGGEQVPGVDARLGNHEFRSGDGSTRGQLRGMPAPHGKAWHLPPGGYG